MKKREKTHIRQTLETVLSLISHDIVGVKLQILPGSVQGEVGEAYVLVGAGSTCSDQLIIQILPAEYIALKQLFPHCSPSISGTVPLAKLTEVLRRLMIVELMTNLN